MTPRPDRAHAEGLGTRPLGRLLWWSCSQTTLSVGVYGIYALTNAWFVSHLVGETALAAVAVATPLLLLVGAIATTVGVGAASLVSRALGGRRPDDAARATGNAMVLFWAVAVATAVAGLALLDPLLRLLGATDATMPYARPYATVILAGAVVSTGFSAVVRAEGRLGFSTLMWVSAVVVQIVLDPVLIVVFDLGVAGAAWGTVGGQAVSSAMALWFFFLQRDRPYRIAAEHLRPRAATLRPVIAIGAPSFLAGLGATAVVASVNASLAHAGAAALAAFAVCARVQTFVSMPQIGITQGTQPVVSFSAGAGLRGRVTRAAALSMRATVVYGLASALAVVLAAEPIAALFLDAGDARAMAVTALRVIAVGFVFAGVVPLASGLFQATGEHRPSYWLSVGTVLLIRLPLVLALGAAGPVGIWIALPAGEALAALVAAVVLRRAWSWRSLAPVA